MKRVLWAVLLPGLLPAAPLFLATGCQTQNPFAAVGPATVPAPSTGQTLPYYPPNVTGAAHAGSGGAGPAIAAPAKSPRVSVSAEQTAPAPPRAPIVADAADREPIRIVENNSPAVRTANANSRGTPAVRSLPATAPAGTMQPTPNPIPIPAAPASGKSGYAPAGTSSATNRMRGFAATGGDYETSASGVASASYQQPVPTFSEATAADGQWRAR